MRAKFSLCILFATVMTISMTVPAFSYFATAEPTMKTDGVSAASSSSTIDITIDGDLGDWAGVTPVATDPSGDTFQWSKNATIVGVGSTAEKAADVAKNDKCRDLKALYFVSDIEKVYMRLDVEGLYAGWNNTSMHPGGLTYPNVSYFIVNFDYLSGGFDLALAVDEIQYQVDNRPDFYLEWDGNVAFISKLGWIPILDNTGLGGIEVATNITEGAFEFSFDRAQLESALGAALKTTDVWAMSYKPGEDEGGYSPGTFRRVFDPQAPGTPGEDVSPYALPWWPGDGSMFTWEDPWGVDHNLTTSPAVNGMNGIHNETGQPITLTYPVPIDFADTFSQTGNNLDTFTFAPASWADTKATLNETAKFEVDLGLGAPSGPKAVFTYSPFAPGVNEPVTFNASDSLPGWNGTHNTPIVSYEWDFGDGSSVTEADPVATYNYTAAGAYTVTLNVTDSQGWWNATSKTVLVEISFDDFEEKLVVLPWVAYAPTHFDPSVGTFPNETEIRDDLQLLYDTGFLGVITYGSEGTLYHVPRIAKEIGFQGVIMGIWNPTSREEIENAKNMAEYVDGYCVGNEGLNAIYDLADLQGAMEEIRDTLKPVTTTQPGDHYLTDVSVPASTLREIGDWLFPNYAFYAYWNGRDPEASVNLTVDYYNELKSLEPDKAILIKETGFPSAGNPECNETSQAEYFRLLQRTNVSFAYFEAFDQPWKGANVEPHWGLFRNDRSPKEVVKYLGRGTCFPSDSQGNVKNTFYPGEEVYVKGYGFPIDTEVDIYLIPDGASFTPDNSKANASQITDSSGNLSLTFIWKANETNHFDIWIDVGQNGIRDKFDVVNDETVNTYPINVIPEFPTWTSMLLILIVLTVATAIYKRKLPKTPIQ